MNVAGTKFRSKPADQVFLSGRIDLNFMILFLFVPLLVGYPKTLGALARGRMGQYDFMGAS